MASRPPPLLIEKSSAIIRWGVDIPSPMNRKMYFITAIKSIELMLMVSVL
jgi:hypothetical protein